MKTITWGLGLPGTPILRRPTTAKSARTNITSLYTTKSASAHLSTLDTDNESPTHAVHVSAGTGHTPS